MYAEAVAHHRSGQLDRAEAGYRSIPPDDPKYPDSVQLLGVIAQQRGDHVRAVELIGSAIAMRPNQAEFHSNLAEAHRALGQLAAAEACCAEALRLKPNHPEALLNLGRVQMAGKRWADAGQTFNTTIQLNSHDARGHYYLGECLREMGRNRESIAAYGRALACNPRHAHAFYQLATQQLLLGDAVTAEASFRRAIEISPRLAPAYVNLGRCLIELGRAQEAAAVFDRAQQIAPGDPLVDVSIGQALAEHGALTDAVERLQRAMQLHPHDVRAVCGLADVVLKQERPEDALALYENALKIEAHFEPAQRGLSNACLEIGDVERAVANLREAIGSHPNQASLHSLLGTILASAGELEGSVAEQREALRLNPESVQALSGLASTLRGKLPPTDLELLEQACQRPASAHELASLHFGMAQVYDARDEFHRAAEHLALANRLQKQHRDAHNQRYDPAAQCANVDSLIRLYTPDFFTKVRGFGNPSELPVFVVGMPRSGTTLVEQIMASHPRVYGAGERRLAHQSLQQLPQALGLSSLSLVEPALLTREAVRSCADWHLQQLQQLSNAWADRVVDKMPDNYQNPGWLATIFPRARFIHCRRDVRDVALSCWTTNFAHIRWANDLEHLARRILDYRRLMAHWRAVLPVPILEIDYEELVADQEVQSRRLIDWLGLDWDPACLEFHKTERLVRTASVAQVRQPMYSRSVQRWKHYEKALEPLLRILNEGETKPPS
jgi:tetratricopeptide (TPR) repeat protein